MEVEMECMVKLCSAAEKNAHRTGEKIFSARNKMLFAGLCVSYTNWSQLHQGFIISTKGDLYFLLSNATHSVKITQCDVTTRQGRDDTQLAQL